VIILHANPRIKINKQTDTLEVINEGGTMTKIILKHRYYRPMSIPID